MGEGVNRAWDWVLVWGCIIFITLSYYVHCNTYCNTYNIEMCVVLYGIVTHVSSYRISSADQSRELSHCFQDSWKARWNWWWDLRHWTDTAWSLRRKISRDFGRFRDGFRWKRKFRAYKNHQCNVIDIPPPSSSNTTNFENEEQNFKENGLTGQNIEDCFVKRNFLAFNDAIFCKCGMADVFCEGNKLRKSHAPQYSKIWILEFDFFRLKKIDTSNVVREMVTSVIRRRLQLKTHFKSVIFNSPFVKFENSPWKIFFFHFQRWLCWSRGSLLLCINGVCTHVMSSPQKHPEN